MWHIDHITEMSFIERKHTDMDKENQQRLEHSEDILFLENLFFVREETIRANDELVRKSFQDLYKYVNYN